jgi:hypothetical protein
VFLLYMDHSLEIELQLIFDMVFFHYVEILVVHKLLPVAISGRK